MRADTISLGLLRDAAVSNTAVASQRWILTAMQKHGPGLITMLWRILGNEEDVCDTYQDAFLQLAHCRGGNKPDHIKAFVYRTASNVAISILRRRKRHEQACRTVADRAQQHEPGDALGDLDVRQSRETLRGLIARLPDGLRGVVLLRDLAELPYSQVAKMLGISVETARVYRCRAVRQLSAWMTRGESG